MSLLLDALKRAEQEKLARGAPSSGFETESPRMAPVSAPTLELQPVETGSAGAQAPANDDARAAQNVFAAKAAAAPGTKRRGVLWLGLALIVLVVLGAGGYVWYSIQALSAPSFQARPKPRPPAAPMPQPASSEPSSASKMEALVALAANNPAPSLPSTPPTARAPDAPANVPAPSAEPAPNDGATNATAPAAAARPHKNLATLLRDNATVPAQEPLTLQRSAGKPRVAPQVASAYASLVSGDLERARRDYANALAEDSSNIDALLGLATAEARLNQPALAAASYRKALEIDPRNATARAGLAALPGGARGQGGEGELRSALAAQPESAPLHFTLGNLYASQGRWNDAQYEFFEAHRLDPGNADVQFNLAVALDHIGQSRLAREFYERAVDSAARQAVQFDPAAVMRRVGELRQAAR